MDLSRYHQGAHGKLTLSISIPVDQKFREIVDTAKKSNFDFNAWARDVLKSRIHEVIEFCSEKVGSSESN